MDDEDEFYAVCEWCGDEISTEDEAFLDAGNIYCSEDCFLAAEDAS